MEKTIKFYANYKDRRYFISGKNEENKWFSLWKNQDFNNELYLDTTKFKGGVEIEKSKLKLLANEDGTTGKVLVFKNAEDEKKYCISKDEIEKRKNQPKTNNKEYIENLFYELFRKNPNLEFGELIDKIIQNKNSNPDELEEISDGENLPF